MGKVACFAEYAVVPEAGCIPAPAGLGFPQMALIGCSVTTGVGAAVFNGGVAPGDSVAVIGCGGVGSMSSRARGWPAPRRSWPWT